MADKVKSSSEAKENMRKFRDECSRRSLDCSCVKVDEHPCMGASIFGSINWGGVATEVLQFILDLLKSQTPAPTPTTP